MAEPSGTVELERDGETYSGEWTTEKGMITVRFRDMPPKTTQLGESAAVPEVLAKIMLGELVTAYLSTHGQ